MRLCAGTGFTPRSNSIDLLPGPARLSISKLNGLQAAHEPGAVGKSSGRCSCRGRSSGIKVMMAGPRGAALVTANGAVAGALALSLEFPPAFQCCCVNTHQTAIIAASRSAAWMLPDPPPPLPPFHMRLQQTVSAERQGRIQGRIRGSSCVPRTGGRVEGAHADELPREQAGHLALAHAAADGPRVAAEVHRAHRRPRQLPARHLAAGRHICNRICA